MRLLQRNGVDVDMLIRGACAIVPAEEAEERGVHVLITWDHADVAHRRLQLLEWLEEWLAFLLRPEVNGVDTNQRLLRLAPVSHTLESITYLIGGSVVERHGGDGERRRKISIVVLHDLPERLVRTSGVHKVCIHVHAVVRGLWNSVCGRGNDPKVATSSADGPEEIGVLMLRHLQELAVRGHHPDGLEGVQHQPLVAVERADAAS